MKQHGRKSTAALAAAIAKPKVIEGGFSSRKAEPPKELTEAQAKIWRETVAGEPASFFGTATTRAMLMDYCCLRQEAAEFTALINEFPPEALREANGMRRYEWLARQRDRASKAATTIATKLRLTNQSRWQPQGAATAAEAAPAEDDDLFCKQNA